MFTSAKKKYYSKYNSNPYLGIKASSKIQEIFPHNKQNIHSAYGHPADMCGWDASHRKVMILWKAQIARFVESLPYSSHKMICVFTCKKKTCLWIGKPYGSMALLPAVIFIKCILSWYGNTSQINYLWFSVFKILKMAANVRHVPLCPPLRSQNKNTNVFLMNTTLFIQNPNNNTHRLRVSITHCVARNLNQNWY